MGRSSPPTSELIEAARVLEEELDRFAKLALGLEKEPLSSKKSLDRAGNSLLEIADTEDRLPSAMNALMTALGTLRKRHEEQTEAVKRRAEEIRQRSEIYRQLLERLGALASHAGEVNTTLGRLAESAKSKAELVVEIDAVLAQIGEAGAAIDALERESKELRFEDLGRQADSLSSELGKARSKLARLRKQLAR